MLAHKGQSRVGDADFPPSSSPCTTNFMLPVLVHTMSMALDCTMGDAMATPTDMENHTSTKRMMWVVLRQYCMSTIISLQDLRLDCAKCVTHAFCKGAIF